MLGMTVLSVIGFLALSFTIIGGIAGGVLGLGLGRYAGRKLKKKIKNKGPLTQEELYITKLECLLKLGSCEVKFATKNLNKYRLILEKVSTFDLGLSLIVGGGVCPAAGCGAFH